jgi:hypothetical protein
MLLGPAQQTLGFHRVAAVTGEEQPFGVGPAFAGPRATAGVLGDQVGEQSGQGRVGRASADMLFCLFCLVCLSVCLVKDINGHLRTCPDIGFTTGFLRTPFLLLAKGVLPPRPCREAGADRGVILVLDLE